MPEKVKRRQYFIQARFQLKYAGYILLFLYMGAIIAGYTVYWTTWVTLGEKLASVYPQGRLVYIFRTANWILFWRLVFLTPLFVTIGILLSHRIAGPVFRITRYVNGLRHGERGGTLKLRKRDELKELALSVERLSEKMRDDSAARAKLLEELEAGCAEGRSPDPVREIIEKLKALG